MRLRSPISVRETLEDPQLGVQTGRVALQAGAAVALGVLLTPVAAVLAFIDGGLAKDANCAALVGLAEQQKGLQPRSD